MDPVSVAGLAIAVAQVTSACLKSSGKLVGPSKHNSKTLLEIMSDLYSFNAAIKNLQTHLEANEEDQGRLNALSILQEPLETSKKALEMIKSRLEDPKFMHKYVLGARFDEKLKGYLGTLKIGRRLFDDVLLMDQRLVFSFGGTSILRLDILTLVNINFRTFGIATERYTRIMAEDISSIQRNVQDLNDRSQRNHQEMRTWQVNAEQHKQSTFPSR